MERNQGLWKGALIYGGVNIGLFAAGLSAIYLLGENPVVVGRFLQFLLAPAIAFIMLRIFKEQWNRGFLHFWEGMTMGFIYALLVGIGSGLTVYLYLTFDPELLEGFKTLMLEQIELQKQNMGEDFTEEMYKQTVEAANNTTPGVMFGDFLLKAGGPALLATSFIAIFMRKTEAR